MNILMKTLYGIVFMGVLVGTASAVALEDPDGRIVEPAAASAGTFPAGTPPAPGEMVADVQSVAVSATGLEAFRAVAGEDFNKEVESLAPATSVSQNFGAGIQMVD